MLLTLYIVLRERLKKEDGQDLVEYALIACMIALGCAAGMSSIAAAINQVCFTEATDIINTAFH